jgi:hypothetical protein
MKPEVAAVLTRQTADRHSDNRRDFEVKGGIRKRPVSTAKASSPHRVHPDLRSMDGMPVPHMSPKGDKLW